MLVPGSGGGDNVRFMFSGVKRGVPIECRLMRSHSRLMQLDGKDWVIGIIIAALLASVPVFEETTYLANSMLILIGLLISFLILRHRSIIVAIRMMLLTMVWILVFGTGYYIYSRNFEIEMRRNYGRIYPSNVETPDKACGPGD